MGQRKQKSQGKEKKIKKSGTPQKDVEDVLRLVPRDLEQAQEQLPGNPYQESGALKTGSVYGIAGLRSEAGKDLNGRWCEVLEHDMDSKRYLVRMDPQDSSEDFKKIKEDNLRIELQASYNDTDVCRICQEGNSEEALVAPCACRGTMKWVHVSCIQKWYMKENEQAALRGIVARPCCKTCDIDYSAPLQITLLLHARGKIEQTSQARGARIEEKNQGRPQSVCKDMNECDVIKAHIDSELASSYVQIESIGKASKLYESALPVLRKAGFWHQLVDALEGYSAAIGMSSAELLLSFNEVHHEYRSKLLQRAALLEEACGVIHSNDGPSSNHAAKCMRMLCGVQHELGRQTEAWESARKALEILNGQAESNTAVALEKACVLRDMATFKWTENEPAEAKQLLNQSLSLLNRFLGRTHRVYLETAELLTRINADPMI
jgi:hypothetical protein